MDANTVVSLGKSSQSNATKGVGILLVKDDFTCNNIVGKILQRYRHQELHTGSVFDVLNAIWEAKDGLRCVLTNADNLESNGTEIVQHLQHKLGLSVQPLSCDKTKIESRRQPFTFAAYVIYGSSKDGEVDLLQFASGNKKGKTVAAHQEEEVQRATICNAAVETNNPSPSVSDAERLNQKLKGVELSEGSKDDRGPAKKPRVVWTADMHNKFLAAIEALGCEKAVPKKIVEVMALPGLTRENVASHLQKYRGSLKRTQESVFSSFPGKKSTRKEFEETGVLSSPSTSRLNSLQTNMTLFPRSSYLSAARESVSPSNLQYLNTSKDFSFGATSGRQNYNDRIGLDELQQKYVPKLQFTTNYRIYGDPTRSMLLATDRNNSSDNSFQSKVSKFVGYRLTSNLIEYGDIKASIDKINREAMVSTPGISGNDQLASHIQHNSLLDQGPFVAPGGVYPQPSLLWSSGKTSYQCQSVLGIRENENPTRFITTSAINMSRELVQCPSTSLSSNLKKEIPVQAFQDSGDVDTEKCLSLLDQDESVQFRETPANIAALQNLPLNDVRGQNASTASLIRPRDQDFPMPQLETPANDSHVQNPAALLEGISQQHYSPSRLPQMLRCFDEFFEQSGNDDDAMLIGTGSTSHQFDLEEFDDTLYGQDD